MANVISSIALALGTSASPGAQSITVPSGATLALITWTGWGGTTRLTGLSASFSDVGIGDVTQAFSSEAEPAYPPAAGAAAAAVSATGEQTLTMSWSAGWVIGPNVVVTFFDEVDLTNPVVDVDLHAPGFGTLPGVTVSTQADGLMVVHQGRISSGEVPTTQSGFTSSVTETNNNASARVQYKMLSSTGSETVNGTGDAGHNQALVVAVLRNYVAEDLEPPTLTGSITVASVTQTGYSLSWPAGSDNAAVTGYEISLDGGSTWPLTSATNSRAVSGRTAGAVDQVRVRAYDAAANVSTPALSTSVQLEHPGILGSTILASTGLGEHGPGILYNDMRVGDDGKRYYFEITRWPTNGVLDIAEDGTFTYEGEADTFEYELFENSLSLGLATVSLFGAAPEEVPDPPTSLGLAAWYFANKIRCAQ